ncbi:hypothetical protein TTRE_0000207801 [Trichuris trichiura]|uniref:Uncharacterized protein n=1 Tax=Trichuris trichiura TaxID=36087 RepID=A0A077Z159_TRITR|nr:hypothetical protein TTRE_0000207801 [Trichuris trichiura]
MSQDKPNNAGQSPNAPGDRKEGSSEDDDDDGSSEEDNLDLDSQATLLLVHTEVFDVEHQALATERDPQKSERIMKSLMKKARKEVKKKNVGRTKKKSQKKKGTKKKTRKDDPKQSKDLDLVKIKKIVEATKPDEKATDKIQRNRLAWLTGIRMLLQKQKNQQGTSASIPAKQQGTSVSVSPKQGTSVTVPAKQRGASFSVSPRTSQNVANGKPIGTAKLSLRQGSKQNIPPIATPPWRPVSPTEQQRLLQQKRSGVLSTSGRQSKNQGPSPQSKLGRRRSLPTVLGYDKADGQGMKGGINSPSRRAKKPGKTTSVQVPVTKDGKSPKASKKL